MKKLLCILLCILMVTTLFTACGNKEAQTAEEKDTLIIAVDEDIPGLDPFAQNTSLQNTYTILNYDSLLSLDPATGEVQLGLAESYDVISATEYVFHLRQGIKFHEGQELKASDVKFSIQRAAESTGMSSKVSTIEEVIVEDDYTVRILLNTPSTAILNNLAFCGTSIMCEEWCNEHSDSFKNNGTGPYKFVEWKPGESITFERNDEYWGEPGKMKYLKFVVMTEANARTVALETGEVDVNAAPATIDYERFEESEDIELYSVPSTNVHYMALCFPYEPLQNLKVRQAIAYAINKDDIIAGYLDGYGVTKTTLLGSGQQYADDSIPGYEYNPEKAKQLLAEAGYPDGFDITISIRGETRSVEAAIIQSQLAAIGINASIEKLEGAAFVDKAMAEEAQLILESWQPATSDADNPLRNVLYSESKASSNESRYNSAEFDAIIDEALQETDPEKAQELYSAAQMKIYEDVPLIPLFANYWTIAANKHVQGITIPAVGDAMVYKTMYWE